MPYINESQRLEKKLLTGLGALVFIFCLNSSNAIAHGWKAPKEVLEFVNPLARSSEVVSKGENVYRTNCSACHGLDARGNEGDILGLSTDPPDLLMRAKHHPQGDLFWKIKKGRKDMPGFEGVLQDNDIWSIIHFLKSTAE